MAKRKSSSRGRSRSRRLLIVLFKVTLVAAVLAAIGVVWLDAQVRTRLAERLWQAPAQVFARPLHLYPEMPLRPADLERELTLLGYRKTGSADKPGDMVRVGNNWQIYLRAFTFDDGHQPARRIRVFMSERRVAALQDARGRDLDLVKLEPVLLGSVLAGRSEARELVTLDEVPPLLIHTLLLIEDRTFFEHWGLSLRSIGRALVTNLQAGRTVQGGSTLTQQLVKNVYLDSDRTLLRKGTEAIMAMLVELHYSKETILEAYLNEVYLGQQGPRAIHGFALASRHYFNRPLDELRPEQIAMLVGMVKGPSQYDPFRRAERVKQRRDLVLSLMAEHGLIERSAMLAARQRPLGLSKSGASDGLFPAYLDLVRRQLQRDYNDADLREQGLRIFTSFDPLIQHHAERSLSNTLDQLDPSQEKQLEGAMVVTDVVSGDVLAVVGGRRSRFAGFNRALDAVRPIGSLVKPAVYLAALEQPGYTLATLLSDAPVHVKGPQGQVWSPTNFDKKFNGPTPLYKALAHSYNAATARLGMEVGLPLVLDTLQRLGVARPQPSVPALLLGAGELSPFEVAMMYQTIAADGVRMDLRTIRTITSANGTPLARYPQQLQRVFEPAVMHGLQFAMREVMRSGTGRAAVNALPGLAVAGKTGTSDGLRDSWFAGFSGDLLAVVWMGRDGNGSTGLTGSSGALRAWLSFMQASSHVGLTLDELSDVEYVWVEENTGLRSREGCPGAQLLPFTAGSAPTRASSCGEAVLPAAPEPVRRAFRWLRDLF
ncbi:MAG: penicillin-binding protein 1B [Spongiibacteraceae bacterium]|jgi:penicillin-binding protein 1B|nr:penicillin-binding protein 1B [Spongiibacteraceae bacterium]